MWIRSMVFAAGLLVLAQPAMAGEDALPKASVYDAELAKAAGGNDNGMRSYVLVVLKTGPNKVAPGPERSKMFEGHMANIGRLAGEQKLVIAGPPDGVDGWRGIFILNTADIAVARTWVATDPVIMQGEMVAEYHKLFASAGLMLMNDIHKKISKK
jgi:uncharacterized protein YciI